MKIPPSILKSLIALAVLVYVRPKQLTLSIGQAGVIVANQSQRILLSKSLEEVSEVRLARWGHVLKFPIGWISILEAGHSEPRYFGPVSGRFLSEDVIYQVHVALDSMKAEQDIAHQSTTRSESNIL